MTIQTTCIGAYPKPDFVKLPDWFNLQAEDTARPTRDWVTAKQAMGEDAEEIITRGVEQAVNDQVTAGISIPTDGEIQRENYVHFHCRHLHGFDFNNLTNKELRGGSYSTELPTIVGPVSARIEFLTKEWKRAQQFTDRPVKITLPGPMTISDTSVDDHYHDPVKLGADIADALNIEIRALANAGCIHIQIDEPLFARNPTEANAYGFENLERAFHRCPSNVTRTVHMCCGYPDRLDHPEYPKADPGAYLELVDNIEYSSINAVSIEDAHCHNDLALLEKFGETKVILGVVAIANSEIESVDEIASRIRMALNHIEADRLIAAPDCGLGLLDRKLALAKLKNLCSAAEQF